MNKYTRKIFSDKALIGNLISDVWEKWRQQIQIVEKTLFFFFLLLPNHHHVHIVHHIPFKFRPR